MRKQLIALVCIGALGLNGMALADFTASFYQGGGTLGNFSRTTGWFFRPNENLVATALGIYDHDAPGLSSSHDVGIFTAAGAPVATTTLPSGMPGTLIDGTRFLAIPPAALNTGQDYYIIANNWSTDRYAFGAGAVTYAPEVTWLGFGDGPSNSIFDGATNLGGLPGNLGPNFRFIPEPTSFILLVIGTLSLARRR